MLEIFVIVEMIFDVVGIWMLYCYVNIYLIGGMNVLFIVLDLKGKFFGLLKGIFLICLD